MSESTKKIVFHGTVLYMVNVTREIEVPEDFNPERDNDYVSALLEEDAAGIVFDEEFEDCEVRWVTDDRTMNNDSVLD